jgi:hypothetical protein
MVDEEAILRFFAMRAKIGTYRTPLKKFLNDYMSEVRNASDELVQQHRAIFDYAVNTTSNLLGPSAFRMLGPDGTPTESAVNRALLESQLLAFSWVVPGQGLDPAVVKQSIAALFQDELFSDAVQRATGDRSRTLRRARETVAALRLAGVQVEVPHNLQN